MVCVLFSRPRHDGQMAYLYHYSKELVSFSKIKGHKTLNKEGEEANKLIILGLIQKQKPFFIMFNGHGSPDVICGHKNEVIISTKKNPEDLSGTITYSLSCSSANRLGKLSIEKGAIAFVGYEMDFALGKDPDSEAAPAKDKIAELFLRPSNILVESILAGKEVDSALDKARKKMKENIMYLNTTNEFPEAKHYAPFLFGNYMGLVAYGDEKASLN